MCIHKNNFQKIHTSYKLDDKIDKDGYVYCVIQKGVYGLKQAAILVYNYLKKVRYGRLYPNRQHRMTLET